MNAQKTRLMGQGNRQTVTGVVVNQVLGLPRQERRRLRAAMHQLAGKSKPEAGQPPLRARVEGKLAYLAMLNPQQAAQVKSAAL